MDSILLFWMFPCRLRTCGSRVREHQDVFLGEAAPIPALPGSGCQQLSGLLPVSSLDQQKAEYDLLEAELEMALW